MRAFLLQRLVKKCRKLRGGKEEEEKAEDLKPGPLRACLEEIQSIKVCLHSRMPYSCLV